MKNQEKKTGYVWYKIEYDGKSGYVSRNPIGNLLDINFKFIVKDGLPKKLFDEKKTQEDSYIVSESETKGINISGKLKNKVRIKDGDMYLAWDIDIAEMKKQNPEIIEYNEGIEQAKQGIGMIATNYNTGNIAKLKNGEFVKIIRKGDISKDRKNWDIRYNYCNSKIE